MTRLSDSEARERAAKADDRNIVVTAGAGTGKTTLLVSRLLHLLLYRAEPLAIGEIVALTFTNKAADEIKHRLRLSLNELTANELAANALRDLDQSQIGTIHGFAAHLLRLYPLESQVDPGFQQDEGRQFDEFFRDEWTSWLDRELGARPQHEETWKAALMAVTLEDLEALARGLVNELIPLDENIVSDAVPPAICEWLIKQAHRGTLLRRSHPKLNILEQMLEEAARYLQSVGRDGVGPLPVGLDRGIPPITVQWSPHEYDQAKHIIYLAQAMARVRTDLLQPIMQLLVPFAHACRRRFIQTGYVSFDGLVARARNLLRDHPTVRRELKSQFRSILVDEFQDTDPVQYEMILYLAEVRSNEATDWRRIALEPGKLFIVGDPKQSIYAFRRADMEAYDTVVEDHILAQRPAGERHTLQTNFRSHAGLLAPINGFFRRVFPEQAVKGLQPRHDPLVAHDTAIPRGGERVEIRLVQSEEDRADTETVGRAEAEELARWLKEDVLHREEIFDFGVSVKARPRHIAILFRTLTEMREYVEALRRHSIPCLTEGERHFYERQEVIDAINLLRAVIYPHDRCALIGVLRSSLGALTDAQIERLNRHDLLDYRTEKQVEALSPLAQAAYTSAAPVYALLRDLSAVLPHLSPSDVMEAVLARAPCLELAAASIDGEQAVANVLKLRTLVEDLARQPMMTLQGLVDELTTRALDVSIEAESSLAEEVPGEGEGFVRLLSIHKAKGLEFPIVILAGLQRGAHRTPSRIMVGHDWSSGIVGLKVGDLQTMEGIFVEAKLAERQHAERIRLLYVAMTRAKRKLVLSAGIPRHLAPDSFLKMIVDGFGVDPAVLQLDSAPAERSVDLSIDGPDDGRVFLTIKSGKAVPMSVKGHSAVAWHDLHDDATNVHALWERRIRRRDEIIRQATILTPSLLRRQKSFGWTGTRSPDEGLSSETARRIGTLVHRILQEWDFQNEPTGLPEQAKNLDVASSDELSEIVNMLEAFSTSDMYQILRKATIIGREIPFAIPWASDLGTTGRSMDSVMEGVIDLVYRLDGELWVADYKTDRISDVDALRRAEDYRVQAHIYTEAVTRSLGEPPTGFQFIFLRTGNVLPVVLQGRSL